MVVRDDGFAAELSEMALRMHDERTVDETLDRILEFALKAVECAYAGVIFVDRRGTVETVAATHPLVATLDKVQLECKEGPDLDVLHDRYSLIVSDTRLERRWPNWASRVSAAGIRSLLSVRLYTDSERVGTLNLYDPEPDRFDIADQEVAHIFARHAAVALSSARNVENLWQAVDSRKIIGQAQGILMERYDLSPEQAFSVLSRYSQQKNLKLRLVAERLISSRSLPD